MNDKRPCVYVLTSKRNGTLYVGVTSDIARRAWEHRSNAVAGFVRDYGVHRLVFVEFHDAMPMRSSAKSVSRNGAVLGNWS